MIDILDKDAVQIIINDDLIAEYKIKKIILFGSRADRTNRPDSDVDLIIEFYDTISLLRLAELRIKLENLLGLKVDVIHGPLRENDLLEIKETVILYDRKE